MFYVTLDITKLMRFAIEPWTIAFQINVSHWSCDTRKNAFEKNKWIVLHDFAGLQCSSLSISCNRSLQTPEERLAFCHRNSSHHKGFYIPHVSQLLQGSPVQMGNNNCQYSSIYLRSGKPFSSHIELLVVQWKLQWVYKSWVNWKY